MDKLKNINKGFLTIEIIISLTLIAIISGAIILISFGNQYFLIDAQNNSKAIKIAEDELEFEQALARKDFNLVNSFAPMISGIYEKKVEVTLLPDFISKEIKSIVSWKNEVGLNRNIELSTIISNYNSPTANDTCNSTLSGDWNNPIIKKIIDFSSLPGLPSGIYTLSDVDVYKNKLYITSSQTGSEATLPTLFIFNITDKENPILLGKIDNASNVTKGLNNILVAEDLNVNPNKTYAYATSNTSSNYSTCNPISNQACGQIYIFDVTNPNILNSIINLKITSTPPVIGQVVGKNIFYKNGYLFLGLEKNDGPEFHIIDVHNPGSIISGLYTTIGNFEIGNDVNNIYINNNYAYIASPNDQELIILNIYNLNSPIRVGNFELGSRNGKSLNLVGDKLYFGKADDISNDKDFYILNIQQPENTLPIISSTNILNTSINNIIVRNNLGFFLTNSALNIFDIGNPLNLTPFNINNPLVTLLLPKYGGAIKPSMDCEDNYFYITTNDISGRGYLSIITSN
jgi:hypothetical protein